MKQCAVCGGNEFSATEVLWTELIAQWQLNPDEVAYINRQQGLSCVNCGSNLRSIALASAILSTLNIDVCYRRARANGQLDDLRILEINPAGTLSAALEDLPGHRLIAYPEFDMHQLDLPDDQYDMVVHSDTLEHLEHPVTALAECRRVLVETGSCVFTAPIIPSRLTRSRAGLTPSYHGAPDSGQSDLIVHWEFGADLWADVLRAGYSQCAIHSVEFPGGLAVVARK